jgi:RNA polymerase sigma factor (sigma-70 family)
MKGFARSVPLMISGGTKAKRVEFLGDLPDARGEGERDRLTHRDEVRQLLAQLDERERTILRARFGLSEDQSPATFEQVGERLGLSKQRVRQIEQTAMTKLRALVELD